MVIDIVILPPLAASKQLSRSISQATKGVPLKFVVDGKKLHYHMSLYHIRLENNSFLKLVSLVKQMAEQYKSFQVKSKGFYFKPSGGFGLGFSKNKVWEKMQKEIVRSCKYLRSGPIPWTLSRDPSKEEQKSRELYGSSYLYPLTKPHFTIGKLRNPDNAEFLRKNLRFLRLIFCATTVGICLVDKDYQVTKVLKEFKLK